MARTDSFVGPNGVRLDIVATQAGQIGIDLNLLEAGLLVTGFRLAGPADLLLVLATLADAGAYLGWVDDEVGRALGAALKAAAPQPGSGSDITSAPDEGSAGLQGRATQREATEGH